MDHYTPFSPKDTPQQQPPPEPSAVPDSAVVDVASEDDEKQERSDYLKAISPTTLAKSSRKRLLGIVAIVVVLLIGAGAYAYVIHPKPAKPQATAKTAGQTVPVSNSPTATTTSHYVSNGTDLNLSFDYPADWTVTPASGTNTNDQTITLNSPLTTIPSAGGASVTGKVTVSLRPASAGLNELSSGSATAGQTSVQIAYAKPTSVQFQYPFLAFIHLKGGNNPTSAFEEVLVGGTTQINKGDSITTSTLTPDPIISASFVTCASTACTGTSATPLSITNDTWLNISVFQQTLKLFESLQIN